MGRNMVYMHITMNAYMKGDGQKYGYMHMIVNAQEVNMEGDGQKDGIHAYDRECVGELNTREMRIMLMNGKLKSAWEKRRITLVDVKEN